MAHPKHKISKTRRDNVHNLLAKSGAVTMGCAIRGCGGGDSWDMLACVDRLVELGGMLKLVLNINLLMKSSKIIK